MTILATRALLHDALEAREALIVVRARHGQDIESLSLPCLGLDCDAIWRVCWDARAHVMYSHGLIFTPSIRVARLLHSPLSSTSTRMPVSPTLFPSQCRHQKKFDLCLFSVNLVLALRPLVQRRPLPAHLHVAQPQRRILPSTHIQLLRHLHLPRRLPKPTPPLALVYLGRWLPPRAPSPSDQPLVMASHRCFLAVAPSLHL